MLVAEQYIQTTVEFRMGYSFSEGSLCVLWEWSEHGRILCAQELISLEVEKQDLKAPPDLIRSQLGLLLMCFLFHNSKFQFFISFLLCGSSRNEQNKIWHYFRHLGLSPGSYLYSMPLFFRNLKTKIVNFFSSYLSTETVIFFPLIVVYLNFYLNLGNISWIL